MIKFFKNEGTKTSIQNKINKYKDWFNGVLLGPEPQVEDKIKQAHKEGFEYSLKSEEEFKQEILDKNEKDVVKKYQDDKEKWFNEIVRPERNSRIVKNNWILERDIREKQLNIDTSLNKEQVLEYLKYQQKLADITNNLTYTKEIKWPSKPSFI